MNKQKALYYTLLTLAIVFWVSFGAWKLNDNQVGAWDEPPSTSGDFTACGLHVSRARETYNPDTGNYKIDFQITNVTNQKLEYLAKVFKCRCKEPYGQYSRDLGFNFDWTVCVGEWPASFDDPQNPSNVEVNCGYEVEIYEMQPGEVIERSVTVDTIADVVDPNCGSFQADWGIRRVTTVGTTNMCVPDFEPNIPSHQGIPITGAYGVLFTGKDFDGEECKLKSELQPPVCDIATDPDPAVGQVPLTVEFDGTGSYDPDGEVVSYAWHATDGYTSIDPVFRHTFGTAGAYTMSLVVGDNDELTSSTCEVQVNVQEVPEDKYVCDTRTETCELETNVPVQYRSGVCTGIGDDEPCQTPSVPAFTQEPWVHHVSGEFRVYKKVIKLVSGGSVEDWQVDGGAKIVSESSDTLIVSAEKGVCPTFSALVAGVYYGPYAMQCVE